MLFDFKKAKHTTILLLLHTIVMFRVSTIVRHRQFKLFYKKVFSKVLNITETGIISGTIIY